MPRAKILVIEDNSSDIFLLRRALIALGEDFELEIAADGERALQMIHNGNGPRETQPCAILLDLHLPKHDGVEILRAIQKSVALKNVHVMVTTNMASPKEVDELQRLGVDYRPKPKDLSEFSKLAADLMAICSGSETMA